MAVAALITWIIAALGGFYLLATWVQKGGLRQQKDGPSRFPAPLVVAHLLLAATGLVLWLIYVIADSDGVAWAGFVLVLLTALAGFGLFARWLQGRQAAVTPAAAGSDSTEVAAEQTFPVVAVVAHGLVAATTLVLVLIAALG